MKLAPIACALLLAGCASVGPTVSTSSGLGYARPSVGAIVHLEGKRGRIEARAMSVEKRDGGEGYALAGHALLDLVPGDWRVLVGADGNRQSVERYDSSRVAPRVEVGWRSLGLYWIGEDRKIRNVVGVRALYRERLLLEVESVTHTEGSGSRVGLSWLWRW